MKWIVLPEVAQVSWTSGRTPTGHHPDTADHLRTPDQRGPASLCAEIVFAANAHLRDGLDDLVCQPV
jgi:hypothetical protein